MMSKVERIVAETGFFEYGWVDIDKLQYHQEIRTICEGNSCRNYATSWACPPAIGTLSECRERVNQYEKMLLFTQVYHLESSFDFKGMIAGLLDFKQLVDQFQENLNHTISDFLLLSNEGCGRCSTCTYPDAPCRFPELLHHSLEGYGFIVNQLAKEAGIRYNNGSNAVTYFGALLFNTESN